jgi:dihydroneopterin aldolase
LDDRIYIDQLEVFARVGVPEAERAAPQRLLINLTLWPNESFSGLRDEISNTIDYAAVCEEVKRLLAGSDDKLIETAADKIAGRLLGHFKLRQISVEVRKFVLPNVNYVSVSITRGNLPS